MNRLFVIGVGAFLIGMGAIASADTSIVANAGILSGVQDASNMYSASTNYGFSLHHSEGDPDFYLNSIALDGGGLFDTNANFTTATSLGNGFPANDYTLGTAITGNRTFWWNNVFSHDWAFDAITAPVGIYNLTAIFTGGATADDNSEVFNIPLQLEIVNNIDAVETSVQDTNILHRGETATTTATLQNNMSRDFVTTTWFLSFNGMDFSFQGDWFNKTIAPGDSLTDLHSTFTASATQEYGTYYATTGIVGGLYNGDNFWFGQTNNTTLEVVPEPMSLMGLGLGIAAFAKFRKRSKKS